MEREKKEEEERPKSGARQVLKKNISKVAKHLKRQRTVLELSDCDVVAVSRRPYCYCGRGVASLLLKSI